jgi:flagellar motor switch protein FliN/FliY
VLVFRCKIHRRKKVEDKERQNLEQSEVPETATEVKSSPATESKSTGQTQVEGDSASDKPSADTERPETKEGSVDLNVILDIPLEVTVELGRTKMPIYELLNLGPGSAVTLSRLEGEPVDILANNTLIARGIVLVKNDRYGIRITEITSRLERIKSLS